MGDMSNNTINGESGRIINNDKSRTINKTVNTTNIKGNKVGVVMVLAIVIIMAFFIGKTFITNPVQKIVGRWECIDNGNVYEFTKEGQFLYLSGNSNGITAQYHVDKGTIQIDANLLWASSTVIADLDIRGNKMTWSNFIDPDDIMGADTSTVMSFEKIK